MTCRQVIKIGCSSICNGALLCAQFAQVRGPPALQLPYATNKPTLNLSYVPFTNTGFLGCVNLWYDCPTPNLITKKKIFANLSWIFKSGLTNHSFYWSDLVWSGLEKALFLWLWSLGCNQQPFSCVRGNFGLVTNEQPGETREREKAVFCQKKEGNILATKIWNVIGFLLPARFQADFFCSFFDHLFYISGIWTTRKRF